jgi:iron(III) transport system ATP-binding protein
VTTVSIRNLSKRFTGQSAAAPALRDLSVEIADGMFFTLLGPSGCGKSTLLRCIAGLETADSGEIEIGGRLVFSSARGIDVPPNQRRVGMVFQSYAIWPHMTVIENVMFPLQVGRHPAARAKAMEALALVGLEAFADRFAPKLSGGQQQRVAVARAIVAEPALLLLDEPLSNLDAALREQMRTELQALQRRLRMTTVYVTHDQVEALSLSDSIAVMRAGEFVEIAAPEDLYRRPRSAFSARFVGGANLLEGRARPAPGGGTAIDTLCGVWQAAEAAAEGPCRFFVRPEQLAVRAERPEGANVFLCRIKRRRFIGETTEFDLAVGEGEQAVVLCARISAAPSVQPDSAAWVVIDPRDVCFLSRD